MSDAGVAVAWLLDQDEPEARRVAAQQLVKVHASAGPLLLRALGDGDWRVRKEAASAASTMEPREEVISVLVSALGDTENVGLRNAAVEALIAIGNEAVGPVVSALHALDADGRKLAVEVLGGIPDPRSVEALTESLRDVDTNVRCTAAEALRSAALAGESSRRMAVDALLAFVACEEPFLKLAAFDALTRLESHLPWSVVEPVAKDPLLRRYAVAAAAHSDDPRALDVLVDATSERNLTVVREAVIAIGERIASNPEDAAFVADVRKRLRCSPDSHARVRVLYDHMTDVRARGASLVVLGLSSDPSDIPLFVDALADDELTERAERGLQIFGADALGPLLTFTRRERPERRASVLSLVPTLSPPQDAVLIATLREALADASPDVVVAALRVLGTSGTHDDLSRVATFVTSPDPRVAAAAQTALSALSVRFPSAARAFAAETDFGAEHAATGCIVMGALGRLGSCKDEDVRLVERALAHGDPRTRRVAVEALASMGGDAAAEAVRFALADEEVDVQLAAVRALGQLGRAEPLVLLVSVARDPALVAAALRALSEANPEKTVEAARPLVLHDDAAIACAAVEAIGRLSNMRHREPLFDALEHANLEVVKIALTEIATALDARALARVGACLDHESWEVRRLVAELLEQDGSAAANALLRARLEREKDTVVREAIAAALLGHAGEGG